MKYDFFVFLLMLVSVPLAGELRFYPFNDTFRISLSIPVFFFFLLWIRRIPPIVSGILVGFAVVVFRILFETHFTGTLSLYAFEMVYFPVFIYYATYSFLFTILRMNKNHSRPFLMGALAVVIEIVSSLVELGTRHSLAGDVSTLPMLGEIILIAFIRTFFTLGFFYMIKLNQTYLIAEQQRKQNSHMLLLISNLYEESILLKKSIQDAEDITRDCYRLYENINSNTEDAVKEDLSQSLLGIAGRVHEIKKDNQRINAGLAKMISSQNSTDYMDVSHIGGIILQSNRRYAESLGKNISLEFNSGENIPPLHIYTVLSLINNLVSNSIESINERGYVKISAHEIQGYIEFEVRDNGAGIPPKKRELVFKPGYTTKYNDSGKPSTGMGLPYVRELVTSLQGSVEILGTPSENDTVFILRIPVSNLIQKG